MAFTDWQTKQTLPYHIIEITASLIEENTDLKKKPPRCKFLRVGTMVVGLILIHGFKKEVVIIRRRKELRCLNSKKNRLLAMLKNNTTILETLERR